MQIQSRGALGSLNVWSIQPLVFLVARRTIKHVSRKIKQCKTTGCSFSNAEPKIGEVNTSHAKLPLETSLRKCSSSLVVVTAHMSLEMMKEPLLLSFVKSSLP